MSAVKVMWARMFGTPTIASCDEVGRTLQSFLDRELDERTARRVGRHLELCRRCGMDAAAYREIKQTLRRRAGRIDRPTLTRLQAFAEDLLRDQP